MATIELTINMECGIGRDEDADVYVSHCPALNVYSQGETEEEALEAIKSAVSMHLTTAFDFNRLEKVLRKCGFEQMRSAGDFIEPSKDLNFVRVRKVSRPDATIKQVPITVPLRVLPQQQLEYACAGQMHA
jgi:predicted RNase H-like HicB family nuclease